MVVKTQLVIRVLRSYIEERVLDTKDTVTRQFLHVHCVYSGVTLSRTAPVDALSQCTSFLCELVLRHLSISDMKWHLRLRRQIR